MASLYNISEDLLSIFNEIEGGEGEITGDQYNDLLIKQDELNEKLDNYVKAIKEFQANADFCRKEKQSINDRQNVYKNRVERLKSAVLKAVETFGKEGKTNRYIELPSCRLSTKSTKSVEMDSDRIESLITILRGYLDGVEGYTEESVPLEYINTHISDDEEPFTEQDLNTITLNFGLKCTVNELFQHIKLLPSEQRKNSEIFEITDATAKNDVKESIETYGESNVTIGVITTNNSLLIK